MSNTARAAPSAARRAQFRPRAEGGDAKKKGKGPRNSTLSQNVSEASTSQPPALHAIQGRSTKGRRNQRVPTHFLSLPLGHHPGLATRVSAFTNSLLSHTPAITGLDSSIVVSPARLHLTLGVMHLVDNSQGPTQAQSDNNTTEGRIFTVQEAVALLHSLSEPVRALLNAQGGDGNLRVPLNYAGVLQEERKQKGSSHVFWVGPAPDLVKLPGTLEHTLQEVGTLVNAEFRKAGFITEKRPLKLHCTLINTKYRKPHPKKRYPFNHDQLFSSSVFTSHISRKDPQPTFSGSVDVPGTSTTGRQRNVAQIPTSTQALGLHSVKIMGSHIPKEAVEDQSDDEGEIESTTSIAGHPDFGTWTVQEIQLCQMRGKDRHTGAYISVGSLQLVD